MIFNKQQSAHHAGYSLVETLVAISILLIAIIGPITIVVKSVQTSVFVKEQATATFLAQEGIEAMVALRNDFVLSAMNSGDISTSWNSWKNYSRLSRCFASAGCNIDYRDSTPFSETPRNCATASNCLMYVNNNSTARVVYVLSSSGLEASPYTRVIYLAEKDGGKTVQITSKVTWGSSLFGVDRSVTVTTLLSDAYSNL